MECKAIILQIDFPLNIADVPFEMRVGSGASVGCQISSILDGGLAPIVAVALFATTGDCLSTALYVAGVRVVSFIAIARAQETYCGRLDGEEGR